MNGMTIPECRDFVRKHSPKCCDEQTEAMGYNVTNSIQHFVCRGCGKKVDIKYWPLYDDDIRDLKLNVLL